MTTPDDVRALFDAARDTFEVEEGQPTESYITKLQETLGGILYTVRYDAEKGEHNLIGIVIDDEDYLCGQVRDVLPASKATCGV